MTDPNSTDLATTSNGGATIQRQGFGERSLEARHEMQATAMAAQAQAQIQARYVMALQRPRDRDDVRVKLLHECKRPGFARRAYYSIPRSGAKAGRLTGTPGMVEGLSVRFAEAAIRISKNIDQSTVTLYDDDFRRMIRVGAVDLESNASYSRDLPLNKTVERSEPKKDAVILGKRTNSAGRDVFIIQATEEELLIKESNLISRIFRTEALRFVDSDTLEECERQIIATVRAEDAKDPDAARKDLADAFARLNVYPADLKAYLGHELGTCAPAEVTELRGLYGALSDGAVSWAEVLAEKLGTSNEVKKEEAPKASAAATVADRIAANAKKRAERRAALAASAPPASSAKGEAMPAPAPGPAEREPGEEG